MTSEYFGDNPRSHHERMLAGDPYLADEQMAQLNREAMVRAFRYQQAYLSRDPESAQILGELIGSLGEDVEIPPPLHVDYGTQINIGARTFINYNHRPGCRGHLHWRRLPDRPERPTAHANPSLGPGPTAGQI